jgi:hypothetical protein
MRMLRMAIPIITYPLPPAVREITRLFNDSEVKNRASSGVFPGLLRNAVLNFYLLSGQ